MKLSHLLAAGALILVALDGSVAQAAPFNPLAGPAIGNLPTATPAEVTDFRKQADALYKMKEKAFADGQAEPIVNYFYAKNAVSFGPDGKPIEGREKFLEEYKQVVKLGTVKVEPVRTFVGKDAAWEWVNFRVTQKDRTQKDFTFIMLFVWAKKDGRWLCGGDAYTTGEFPAGF